MLQILETLVTIIMGFIVFIGFPVYTLINLKNPPKNQTRLKFFGKCVAIWFGLLIGTSIFMVVVNRYKPTPEQQQAQEQERLIQQQEKERAEAELYIANLKAQQERQAQKDKEKNTSKPMLASHCQTAVMSLLKNPKSFKIDVGKTEVGKDGDKHIMNLAFYATNSFNANILSVARCEFDENGNILKAQLMN